MSVFLTGWPLPWSQEVCLCGIILLLVRVIYASFCDKQPSSQWLNTMRESFPTATTLVHSIIVSYMDYLDDLPTSVLNTDATWLIPWSLMQDHSTSLSKPSMAPISFRAESYVASNSLECRHLSHSIHLLASLLLLKHAQRIPAQGLCIFSSIWPEYSFPRYPHNEYPQVSVAKSPCQRGLCWTFYIKEHFLSWPSYPLTYCQSHTGCL